MGAIMLAFPKICIVLSILNAPLVDKPALLLEPLTHNVIVPNARSQRDFTQLISRAGSPGDLHVDYRAFTGDKGR